MTTYLKSKPFIIGAVATTAISAALGGYVWKQEHRPPILEIYVFALKTGSSYFIRTPDDQRILINGGSNSEIIRHISRIIPFYSRRIDTIIATDTEGKNVTGLIDIVDRYQVRQAYIPGIAPRDSDFATSSQHIYEAFINALKDRSVEVHEVIEKDQIVLSDATPQAIPVNMEVLFPAQQNNFEYSKASAPELVFQLSYGQTNFTFLGNASKKVQKYIASSTTENFAHVSTNVLIVPHSAGLTNISPELMRDVSPDYLIYSKTISKSPPKKSPARSKTTKTAKASQTAKKKKDPEDPFAALIEDKRFNLKEKGNITIVTDGTTVDMR